MNGLSQNNISTLEKLDNTRYENIFNIYITNKSDKDMYYFYNILNKVTIPADVDPNLIGTITLNRKLPWTTFSYKLYDTTNLWWLIFLLNKPKNIFYAEPGVSYKYFYPDNIDSIINSVLDQVNK